MGRGHAPDGDLSGQVAVVTGASRGIGRAVGVALADAGARVVLAARDVRLLEEVATHINQAGHEAIVESCDVSQAPDVERLFDAARKVGPVRALVCCAGTILKAPLDRMHLAEWNRVLEVNLTGTFLCCTRAFREMRASGGGTIVTLSSLSGLYPVEKFPGLAAYNVSKYGVVGLTEAIALEGRDLGISAICLSPGAVDTDMLRKAAPHLRPRLTPEQVARLITSLLDRSFAPASGAVIPLFSNG